MEMDNLKKYVSEALPEVNKLLRNNEDASKFTFDNLFEIGIVPQPLYRLIDNKHIQIRHGKFTDKGYLSCTSDFDSFVDSVGVSDIACLQFDIPCEFPMIDVCVLLCEYNDEKEIILPRGIEFKLEQERRYSTYNEIQEFLDMIYSVSSAKEFTGITFYELSLVK